MPLDNPLLPEPGAIGNVLTSDGSKWISAIPQTPPTTPDPSKVLTYASDGDANGLFYWLGTNRGIQNWQNPHVANFINISLSSFFSSEFAFPESLVNRSLSNNTATADGTGNTFTVDLGIKNTLNCNYYSLRGRNSLSGHPRGWKFQASTNSTTWIDLDTQTNNSTINQNIWFSTPITDSGYYRYFRILNTGINNGGDTYLGLGEWEFYGTLNTEP